ncbi:MAG TPA: phosphoribosylanthranilate isomerase [Synergistales bacterium]|nr:phosphoribosylanthranilate isomerase [Synergistales bacterium]
MTGIKICGLTRREDVDASVEFGVDALGFILAESPRRVSLEQVADLTRGLPPFISTVAVVVDPEKDMLKRIVASGLFSHIQFHGKEDPALLVGLVLKTIKTFSIATEADLKDIDNYKGTDYFLFDTRIGRSLGGTGKTFNWELLKKIRPEKPFILAGGLGPENVTEAIRICRPSAIDLNSRLEREPGRKDRELIREAVLRVRESDLFILRSETL